MKVKSESEATQSCPTLSDRMDCSLPGFYIHGIFQARVLEWVAIESGKEPAYVETFLSTHFRNGFGIWPQAASRNLWTRVLLTGIIGGLCSGTPLQYSCLENPMDGGAW